MTNSDIDSPLLSSLGIAVFRANPDFSLSLMCEPPAWLEAYFGSFWDAERNVFLPEEFSVVGSFVRGIEAQVAAGQAIESEKVTFEESDIHGGHFAGRIVAEPSEYGILYVIYPADELFEISNQEVRSLRREALASTNFGEAVSHAKEAEVSGVAAQTNHSASFLRTLLDTISDSALVLDPDGNVIASNEQARLIFPGLSSHAVGESGFDATGEIFNSGTVSNSMVEMMLGRAREGISASLESFWEFSSPHTHQRKVKVRPAISETGENLGTIWVFCELKNDFHANPEESSNSEAFEVIGRLAGGVAHDFNNLLAIILGNLSLIELNEDYPPEVADSVGQAKTAAEKATGLIKQLLGYSRKARLNKKIVTAQSLVRESVDAFRSQAGFDFSIDFEETEDSWNVDVDATQVKQVLNTVLENSYDACEGSGEVRIRSREFVLNDQVLADSLDCKPGHYVSITVSDNGPGMSEEVYRHVFDPFFTTKEPGKGTGLGLSNALGILKQHGGQIFCTSAPGEGTTFSIYLPRHRAEDGAATRDATAPLRPLRRNASSSPTTARVLVVDDEDLLRNLVVTMFQKRGMSTFEACNGQEALQVLEAHGDEIDAIILDLSMPVMGGKEAFRRMNEMGLTIPVIVTTGFLVDAEAFKRDTGGKPFAIHSKPYQLADVYTQVCDIAESNRNLLPS